MENGQRMPTKGAPMPPLFFLLPPPNKGGFILSEPCFCSSFLCPSSCIRFLPRVGVAQPHRGFGEGSLTPPIFPLTFAQVPGFVSIPQLQGFVNAGRCPTGHCSPEATCSRETGSAGPRPTFCKGGHPRRLPRPSRYLWPCAGPPPPSGSPGSRGFHGHRSSGLTSCRASEGGHEWRLHPFQLPIPVCAEPRAGSVPVMGGWVGGGPEVEGRAQLPRLKIAPSP